MKNKTFRITVFYLIAIVVSNIFRFDIFKIQPFLNDLPLWTMVLWSPLQAIGVFIGALLSLYWLKQQNKSNIQISFFGTSSKWSLIISILPVILLFILGVHKNDNEDKHYYGLIAGLSTLIYCFFEEIGWRGYLEEEFSNLNEWIRVFIIAVFWYFWHLKFLINTHVSQNLIFFCWLLLGSWGLGKIIQLTKSVLVSASFHLLINILLFNGFIKDAISSTAKLLIIALLLPTWIYILVLWTREKATVNNQ